MRLNSLRSLDEFLSASPLKAQLDPALFNMMTYEGQVWSILFDTNNVGIFYCPSLFKAAGITKLSKLGKTFGKWRSV